jgi:hypothetical protein
MLSPPRTILQCPLAPRPPRRCSGLPGVTVALMRDQRPINQDLVALAEPGATTVCARSVVDHAEETEIPVHRLDRPVRATSQARQVVVLLRVGYSAQIFLSGAKFAKAWSGLQGSPEALAAGARPAETMLSPARHRPRRGWAKPEAGLTGLGTVVMLTLHGRRRCGTSVPEASPPLMFTANGVGSSRMGCSTARTADRGAAVPWLSHHRGC